MRARIPLVAGVACSTIGMTVAFLGILAPAWFLPGTWLLLAGLLLCAAAGVLAVGGPGGAADTVSRS